MAGAFQANAFQNNAFQTEVTVLPVGITTGEAFGIPDILAVISEVLGELRLYVLGVIRSSIATGQMEAPAASGNIEAGIIGLILSPITTGEQKAHALMGEVEASDKGEVLSPIAVSEIKAGDEGVASSPDATGANKSPDPAGQLEN